MPRFTPEEQALLASYVTSPENDVFAVKNLAGIVGAVYARYSRAPGGFRETLLKEFIKDGEVNVEKAQDLIERVLIAYGDDSVGELEGSHVSFENISILATKDIEDRRIGGSPIEQSTRYVFYDAKDADGNFRYYRDPAVMASRHAKSYVETMDFIFQTYADLVEPMKEYYSKLKPMEEAEYDINGDGVKEKYADCTDEKQQKAFRITYGSDMRTKACDTLRALLPIATKTNVGIFGNGRYFQHVLTACYTSDTPEVQDIARQAHEALNQVIPRYVKRAKRNQYQTAIDQEMRGVAEHFLRNVAPVAQDDVTLLEMPFSYVESDTQMLGQMLFPYSTLPLKQICDIVGKLECDKRMEIVNAYFGDRKTRRDRPGRALEAGYTYTFDLCTDFGTYKDLERHRMGSQLRQPYSPLVGFAMPEDLVATGHTERVEACVKKAQELYKLLRTEFPAQAAYATLHGSKVRWMFAANDRAMMHLIELRTTPQGHPSYRKVAQEMHTLIGKRRPWRAQIMQFADHNEYFWARGDAEARQRVKEAALEEKAKQTA